MKNFCDEDKQMVTYFATLLLIVAFRLGLPIVVIVNMQRIMVTTIPIRILYGFIVAYGMDYITAQLSQLFVKYCLANSNNLWKEVWATLEESSRVIWK